MAYKTFSARSGGSAWDNKTGRELILFGQFKASAAKSFQPIEFIVLCEGDAKKGALVKSKRYLYIQTSLEDMDRVKTNLDVVLQRQKETDWPCRLDVCLMGKGLHNNQLAYSQVDL
jgi:hypothetical protein